MALKDKQKLGKCCGIFCSFLACLNIWFFLGLTTFQFMENPFVKIELEGFENAGDDASNWKTAFAVSIGLNLVCMLACFFCTKCDCYKDRDEVVYYKGVQGGSAVNASGNGGLMNTMVNGSDVELDEGVAAMEQKRKQELAGPKMDI